MKITEQPLPGYAWQRKIAVKITAVVMWIVIAITFIGSAYFSQQLEYYLPQKIESDKIVFLNKLANIFESSKPYAENNIENQIVELLKNYDFTSVEIYSNKKIIIIENEIQKLKNEHSTPEMHKVNSSFSVALFVPPVASLVSKARADLLIKIWLALTLFCIILITVIQKTLDKPFNSIIENIKKVSSGDLSIRIKNNRGDEFGLFARFFNEMLDHIQEQHSHLTKTKEMADFANQAKTIFLQQISHEIRTPLNAILGFTQTLQRDADTNSRQHEFLKGISKSGHHLFGIISDILDISKIESGKSFLRVSKFDIMELLSEVVNIYQLNAQQKGLDFIFETNLKESSLIVSADSRALKQILINLIGNSIKFSQKGSVYLRFFKCPDDSFSFEVEDEGPGISEDVLEKIFEPFYQDSAGITYGGTGLGLAIARKQSALMQGSITVKSQVGKGSVFTFNVRLEIANETSNIVPFRQRQKIDVEKDNRLASKLRCPPPPLDQKTYLDLLNLIDTGNITEMKQFLAKLLSAYPEWRLSIEEIKNLLATYDFKELKTYIAEGQKNVA